MTSIVNGIINSTVGLLCSKLRDYAADKLDEGDLSDEKCKQIVARELDDIKSKIDGLSRKDLLASLSFFKEGVTRLYISLEVSQEPCEKHGTENAGIKDESTAEGENMEAEELPAKLADRDFLKNAFELSEMIEKLTIASEDRYKLAKESFRDARRLATEAFNNVGLSVAERLLAGKLRITSRILEGLEDLEAAVRESLLYLKELQDLPAVQAMISVALNAGNGIASRLRARFNQTERDANIQSIQMLNNLLLDLAIKFTTTKMGILNWPTIKAEQAIYHPLLNDHEVRRKIRKNATQVPWYCKSAESISHPCALTSKGEVLSIDENNSIRNNYTSELFCSIPTKDHACKPCRMLGVDEKDNVFAMVEVLSRYYKLFIFDKNGHLQQERYLESIDIALRDSSIRFNKDGRIFIHAAYTEVFYICDGRKANADRKLILPVKDLPFGMPDEFCFTVSNKNELILIFTHGKFGDKKLAMYTVTMDGELTGANYLPVKLAYQESARIKSMVFNHVSETVVVCVLSEKPLKYCNLHIEIYGFSDDGKLVYQFERLAGAHDRGQMLSHSSGQIALVDLDSVIMLQM